MLTGKQVSRSIGRPHGLNKTGKVLAMTNTEFVQAYLNGYRIKTAGFGTAGAAVGAWQGAVPGGVFGALVGAALAKKGQRFEGAGKGALVGGGVGAAAGAGVGYAVGHTGDKFIRGVNQDFRDHTNSILKGMPNQ